MTLYLFVRRVNNILMVVVLLLAGFILAAPFLPEILLPLQNATDDTDGYIYQSSLAAEAGVDKSKLKPSPKENTLVVPDIGVDGEIHEGSAKQALAKGIWHKPGTGDPINGGNMVLLAHRRLYLSGSNTFYHLPKMTVGEKIIVFWQNKEYNYEVTETKTVPPSQVEIEAATDEHQLTLYTCVPLLTSKNRFVVIAKPI